MRDHSKETVLLNMADKMGIMTRVRPLHSDFNSFNLMKVRKKKEERKKRLGLIDNLII